jgi:hypothetical protein
VWPRRDPVIAPAGDEILSSAGYKDVTPNPSIAQLDGPPVQQQQADMRVMGRGETFSQDPRVAGGQGGAQGDMTPGQSAPGATSPAQAGAPSQAQPQVATGHVGERAGIETARIGQ